MAYLVFYGLAATAVTAAILVVFMGRAVYSALALIVCFGATAGLFFQLGAQFIAAIQVIVYAGAIMVLFLFVIMLLDPESEVLLPSRVKNLSGFAFVTSAIGIYYYLRVIVCMYMGEFKEEETPITIFMPMRIILTLMVLGTLYLGILPGILLDLAEEATNF